MRTRYAVVSLGALRRTAAIVLLGATALPSIGMSQVAAGRGFLLGNPIGSLTVRGGWSMAAAGSDIFSFATDNLTLNKRDFSSATGGVDMAFRTWSRTDVVVSADYEAMNRKSEFRKFIDNNHLPIEQMTSFSRVPIMLSVRQYLTTRGRSIGQLAWIPSRFTAYVGAGAGYTWYRFNQHGDFIDFKTMDVFPAVLQSDGWTPSAQLMAGGEWTLTTRFALVTDMRYQRAHANLGVDFSDFGPIDLSGFSTTAGITIRY
jgi:hypothetical protein